MGDSLRERIARTIKAARGMSLPDAIDAAFSLLPECLRELERLEHELHRTNDAIHVLASLRTQLTDAERRLQVARTVIETANAAAKHAHHVWDADGCEKASYANRLREIWVPLSEYLAALDAPRAK